MNTRLSALDFIVCCLSAPNSSRATEHLRATISGKTLDWQVVREIADAERITSTLWVAVRNRGLANELPPNFRGDLWKVHLLNTRRNKRFREQALSVFRILNAIGVRPMILKGGASLFDRTFEDPGSRAMVDLDLLVPGERAEECWAALRRHQYDPISIEFDYSNHHHLRPLYCAGGQGTVEIHREPLPYPAGPALPAALAWNHFQPREEFGILFGVPSATIRVLHSILHTAVVDRAFARADLSLKALYELAALQRAFGEIVDWVTIRDIMAEHDLSEVLRSWTHCMHRWFGDPIPYPVLPTIRSTLHFERTRLQARWNWSTRLVDRAMWYSADSICTRYRCSKRFWPVFNGRVRLASSMLGKSLIHLAHGYRYGNDSSAESAQSWPYGPRKANSDLGESKDSTRESPARNVS